VSAVEKIDGAEVEHKESVRLLKVEEAAQRLAIARTSMFHLLATGEVESIRVGRLRRIPVECLEEYVGRLRRDQASLARQRGEPSPPGVAGG
jgi:excisionase family DNA binding protein